MAGAVLSVGVLAVSATLVVGYAAAGGVSVAATRLAGVADAAALAAADTVSGAIPGVPCERAHDLAAIAGSILAACTVEGMVVTVTVTTRLGPFPIAARARAGPPL